jgi:dihydrodipicolinate synthase/N-acetylneuraminate lyase
LQFLVATLTPFDARGKVDLARLRAHVLWLAAQGVDGFLPTGTTGEFLYLTDREREAIHRTVLDTAGGRPVIPCTWDPSPTTTAYLTDAAREQGATTVLMPSPLYYRLDDDAVRAWYAGLADKDIRVLAYHNPRYLPTPITPALFKDLRDRGLVAGLKDSSQDLWRLRRLAASDPGAVYAGGDRILAEAPQIRQLAGFISAIANAWPSFCLRLFRDSEHQLEDALLDRVNRVGHAGGLRALKSLLRMGCRAPLVEPPDEALMGLAPAEGP